MSRRRPMALRRPEQGWSSLLLLLGMLVLLGVSVADSRPLPILGGDSLTDSLPVLMVAAGLVGYLLARSSLGAVRAHVIGAALAAVLLLLVAGGALTEQSPLPVDPEGMSARIAAVWTRLDTDIARFLAEEIATPTVTTYLVLGAICWTTAQFGAFSVFRYDRGGPAVMAVGMILFLNVGLRAGAELLPVVPVLAVFAALALLLLMRMQLVQQRYAWARRHISDTKDVNRLFLRTGVAFVIVAVVSASSLTVWATVEAQEVNIDTLDEPLEDFADEVSRMLSIFGVTPGEAEPPSLGTSTQLTNDWTQPEGIAFTAVLVDSQLRSNYWWGSANDEYDYASEPARWRTTGSTTTTVPAGGSLTPPGEAEAGGQHPAEVEITIEGRGARTNLFRLPDLLSVDQDVVARKVVGGGIDEIAYTDVLDIGDTVQFTSFVRDYSADSETFTANELRRATGPDPGWVREKYLQGADDPRIVGDRTRALADRLVLEWDTRYEQSFALQNYLRAMEYNPSLGDACDGFDALPECLLTIEEGFCQQYATTMVMTLRAMDIPARFVTGYLPGDREDGAWVVEQQALHNWAEVYFPTVGWVRFDPTPGDVGYNSAATNPINLPETPEEALATPEPVESEDPFVPEATLEPLPPEGSEGAGGPGSGTSASVIISIAGLAAVMLTVVSLLLLFRLRRLPDGDDSLAYRGIVSLATRLGYGPHPSQTEYEYAGTLAKTIPTVRDDLYLVTDTRVESAYGNRTSDDDRRGTLSSAYARIRTALLRLSLRWRR